MGTITVEGLGKVEIAGDVPTAQEQAAIMAHLQSNRPASTPTSEAPAATEAPQKPQLEFPDAPTFAALDHSSVLKKYKSPIDALRNFGEATSDFLGNSGSMMAGAFGPLMTDNPKARQEIVAKQLRGAEPFEDKYGNPMIRHNGKVYYASRPGELDQMDVARAGLGAAISAPAVLAAPASVLGVAAVGGLTAGGQSLLEDTLANLAGGTSQGIDFGKALLATGIGGMAPAVVGKVASEALPFVRGAAAKLTGGLPARAVKALEAAGIDATQLTPKQIEVVAQHGRNRGWNSQEMNTALMKSLGEEFKVPLTTGQLTGAHDIISAEDKLRHGAGGDQAGKMMHGFSGEQRQALNEAGASVRSTATGSSKAIEPEDIGRKLASEYNAVDTSAKAKVTQAYEDAFDPAKLTAAGAQPVVPRADIRNLQPKLYDAFTDPSTGVVEQVSAKLNPNTMEAIEYLNKFSETGALPGAFPGRAPPANTLNAPTDWQTVEAARKYINGLRTASKANPTDARTLGKVLDAFDDTFGGSNPLIANARKLHSERVNLLRPQKSNAVGINAPLTAMSNPQNSGMTVYNAVMERALKSGEGAPMIAHLKKVFANSPEALTALKEGLLSHVLTDPHTNKLLTPLRARTALQKALQGKEGAAYRELFKEADLSQMGRFQSLLERVGETNARINASGSGYAPTLSVERGKAATRGGVLGAGLGAGLGTLTGLPFAPLVGGAIGSGIGSGVGVMAAKRASNKAAESAISGALPYAGVQRRPVGYLANEAANQIMPQLRGEQRARGGYLRTRGR